MKVEFKDLGKLGFKEAFEIQKAYFDRIIDTKIENRKSGQSKWTKSYLLFCEHKPVYTLGKSAHIENLLLSKDELKEREIELVETTRGGDITFHGPGQIVGYPILDLDLLFTDIHRYMRTLEEVVIKVCGEYGIMAGRIEGLTGVWVDHENLEETRKICAMGVKTSRWTTMHGWALNVNTDLNFFKGIIPCGIDDKAVTSMRNEIGSEIDIEKVKERLKFHFENEFKIELV